MQESIDLEAIESLARSAHEGQFRRDGVRPYIEHPQAVVARLEGDAEGQAVAWLHDVLEDTSLGPEDLRANGATKKIVAAVECLTKRKGQSYQEYLEGVKANPLAAKVKIADMLANLADSPSQRQIRKYAKGLLFLTE